MLGKLCRALGFVALAATMISLTAACDGIMGDSRTDCATAEQALAAHAQAEKVASFAIEHFNELDSSHDGLIIDPELSLAFWQMTVTSDEREILQYMRDNKIGTVPPLDDPGNLYNRFIVRAVTLDDLHSYVDRVDADNKIC